MDIQVKDISKIYGTGENKVAALRHASMTIHAGDFISIIGPSGSGKSTLLHIISGFDTPTSGVVLYGGTNIHKGSDTKLSAFRRPKIGFIFQQFNLLPVLTARENIIMPLLLDKKQHDEAYLQQLAALLGLEERLNHLPHELSGGQQQRVAIARALIAQPDIIFADEPTGNLDSKSGSEVMKMLCDLREKLGKTLVIITHDSRIAHRADRQFSIIDGELAEVSRMRSYLSLSWKELKAQKVTSILIAVILSTITTTVIGQSIGMLNAMRQQQAIAIGGEKYATFLQMSAEQLAELEADTRFSYIGPSINLGSIDVNSQLTLGLVEYVGSSLDAYPAISQIQEGRLPQTAGEIALPEDALAFLDFTGKVGDTISLPISKTLRHDIAPAITFTADFILVGITKSNYIGYSYGKITGIVGAGTAEQLLPKDYLYYNVDFRTADKRTFQNTVNDVIEKLKIHELDTSYNQVYLQACGIPFASRESAENNGAGFLFMAAAGVMVGALVLLAAGLVIYNILKISVSTRIKDYGVLRAIGSEKRQLYRIVSLQILLLCLIGTPIGLAVGLLSAKGILAMSTSFFSLEIFLVQNRAELQTLISTNGAGKPAFLVGSAVITLFFAFVAAFPAAAYAAKVPPTVAMAGRTTKVKRRNRSAKAIRNFEAYYARLNVKRNRGRTAITVLSLVMGIAVFIALQSFTTLLNAASGMEDTHIGDYSIVNETVGFSADELDKLRQNSAVSAVAAIQFSLYGQDVAGQISDIALGFTLQPGETFQVVGLNDDYWDVFTDGKFSEEELALLKSGKACIVRNPIALHYAGAELVATSFAAGDTISVAGRDIPILATLDGYDGYISIGNSGFTNGVQVIVSDCLYPKLTGRAVYN